MKEKDESRPESTGTENDFLNRALIAQTIISTMNKGGHMKLKSFYKAKDTINRTSSMLFIIYPYYISNIYLSIYHLSCICLSSISVMDMPIYPFLIRGSFLYFPLS